MSQGAKTLPKIGLSLCKIDCLSLRRTRHEARGPEAMQRLRNRLSSSAKSGQTHHVTKRAGFRNSVVSLDTWGEGLSDFLEKKNRRGKWQKR
jgi:hypothetical protein